MRPDRVKHLVDADRAYLLSLLRLLHEHLLVEVVAVVTHKDVGLLQEEHDVDSLFEGDGGQVAGHYLDTELVEGQCAHVFVGGEVLRLQGCHLVEHRAQVLFDLVAHVDLLLKEVESIHARILGQVGDALLNRIQLVQIGDHDLMDLLSELLLRKTADWMDLIL